MNGDEILNAKAELAQRQRDVLKARRTFARSREGGIGAKLQAVVDEYLAARKAGVSFEDGIKGIEEELRGCGLFRPTQFPAKCQTCDDTGWEERRCWDRQRCARKSCATRHPAEEHRYVVPCVCPAGDRMRAKVRTTDDELAAISRTSGGKKKSGWRQIGS